jgi:hypothetical protein
MNQPSPTPGSHMMYPYGSLPHGHQQQAQTMQQLSGPSPPQSTWAVPQTHAQYYQMPRGHAMGSREESGHLVARSDVATSQSPAISTTSYSNSNSIHGSGTMATTDYFPGVIDTSKSNGNHLQVACTDAIRSMGSKSM